MVTSGTRVVRLISSGALLVRFAVPPEEIATLAVGSRVRVEVEVLRRAFEAEVRQRAPEIDPPSQMIFVEAHLEAPEVAIPSGAVARVTRLVPGAPPAPRCLAP